jgi:aminoglycoside phosphotransferase family enzyme
VLTAFYRTADRVAVEPSVHLARFDQERAVTAEILLRPQFHIAGAEQALERFDAALRALRDALVERVAAGRIVDGHGDMRPEHVCLLQPPVVIDALEFNPRLRRVDPFEELAFLGLECALASAAWIGPRLIAACADGLADAPPARLLHLYTADRALLRARLAMAHLLDPTPRTPQRWAPLATRYVEHALAALAQLAP